MSKIRNENTIHPTKIKNIMRILQTIFIPKVRQCSCNGQIPRKTLIIKTDISRNLCYILNFIENLPTRKFQVQVPSLRDSSKNLKSNIINLSKTLPENKHSPTYSMRSETYTKNYTSRPSKICPRKCIVKHLSIN